MSFFGTRRGQRDELGAVAVRYGMFIVLIALSCAAGVAVVNGWADQLLDEIRRQL